MSSPDVDCLLMPPPPKRLKPIDGPTRTISIPHLTSTHDNSCDNNCDGIQDIENGRAQDQRIYTPQDQQYQVQLQELQNEPMMEEKQHESISSESSFEEENNHYNETLSDHSTSKDDDPSNESNDDIHDEMEKQQPLHLTQPQDQKAQHQPQQQPHRNRATIIHTRFEDIIGHGNAKLRLDEALLPLALPPSIASSIITGIRAAPASILLHGPPGCGKTQLARAVAGEAQAAFLSVAPSDILSKFVGESEASIRNFFKEAQTIAMSTESKCAVLFFDEIDALGQSRGDEGDGSGMNTGGGVDNSGRRILAELLIQMSNLSHDSKETDHHDSGEDEGECEDISNDVDNENGENGIIYDEDVHITNESVTNCPDTEKCGEIQSSISLKDFENGDEGNTEKLESTKITDLELHTSPPISSVDTFDETLSCGLNDEEKTNVKIREEKHSRNDIHSHYHTPRSKPRVIVVAATNRPEDCDPALLRRFAVRVFVGLPTLRDRKRIIRRLLKGIDHSLTSSDLMQLANVTDGYSGSDLESLTKEAVMAPIRDCLRDAALLKAQARRRKKRNTKSPSSISEVKNPTSQKPSITCDDEEEDNKARELLLAKFSSLRPVSLNDFERAISFWMGDQEEGPNMDETNGSSASYRHQVHYDTSSSSEEEEN